MYQKSLLKDSQVIRLYNKSGEHKLSLLSCGLDEDGDVICVDLARPNGQVLYCDVPVDLVDVLCENMKVEEL